MSVEVNLLLGNGEVAINIGEVKKSGEFIDCPVLVFSSIKNSNYKTGDTLRDSTELNHKISIKIPDKKSLGSIKRALRNIEVMLHERDNAGIKGRKIN